MGGRSSQCPWVPGLEAALVCSCDPPPQLPRQPSARCLLSSSPDPLTPQGGQHRAEGPLCRVLPPVAPGWVADPEASWRPPLHYDSIHHGDGADPRTRPCGGGSCDPGYHPAAWLLPRWGQAGWAGGPTLWQGPCREVGRGSEAILSFKAPEHPSPGLTSLGWFFWVTGKI